NQAINLQVVPSLSGQEISAVCPTEVTTCASSSSQFPGAQKYVYTATVKLTRACPDWVFSWGLCCRNDLINTINSPGNTELYIETRLNNTGPGNFCNSSPQF